MSQKLKHNFFLHLYVHLSNHSYFQHNESDPFQLGVARVVVRKNCYPHHSGSNLTL
jgi:hypothetical protein